MATPTSTIGISSRDINLPANEAEIKEFGDFWTAGKSLGILVTGKTGAGKSTLVNALIGKYVAKEGGTHKPETKEVVEYEKSENELQIKVWDSPGLQDGTDNEKEYIADMKAKCKDMHLLLYCISIKDMRGSDLGCDESAIMKLTEAFGFKVWKNAVFVLTFANVFLKRLETKHKHELNAQELENKLFEERIIQWKEKIQCALRKAEVPEELTSNINVEAAGHYSKLSLPGRPYWLSTIWHTCKDVMKEEAQPVMISVNAHRMKTANDLKDEDFQPASSIDVPIVVAETVGLASVAAFAGAGIGAVIGSIVIGVGTLGAGVGIGAAAGGAVGAGVGIAVSLGIEAWQNSKMKKAKKPNT